MSIKEKQKYLIEEFAILENWEERYKHLIEIGKNLKPFNLELKTDDRIIKGCQSKVWLDFNLKNDKLFFNADADSLLPKGLAAILIRVFSGELVNEIINSSIDFIDKIGFHEFLSPSRANGILAMIKQIKFFAIAYSFKNKN